MTTIVSYQRHSASSRHLARELDWRRRYFEDGHILPSPIPQGLVVNWGCTGNFNLDPRREIINLPTSVARAVDKKATFVVLSEAGIPTLKFTESQEEANRWSRNGTSVFCRRLLRGSGGDGIILCKAGEQVPAGFRLYTRHFKCDRELRIHILKDSVIDITQKKRANNAPENPLAYYIRSYSNGWIFARENILPVPREIIDACKKAISVLGLDFGAVDVRVRDDGSFRILEINTAPGIEGTTAAKYVEAFDIFS